MFNAMERHRTNSTKKGFLQIFLKFTTVLLEWTSIKYHPLSFSYGPHCHHVPSQNSPISPLGDSWAPDQGSNPKMTMEKSGNWLDTPWDLDQRMGNFGILHQVPSHLYRRSGPSIWDHLYNQNFNVWYWTTWLCLKMRDTTKIAR